MLRLQKRKEPYWIDLLYGVRVQVHPLTTALFGTAQSRGQKKIQALREQWDDLQAVGADSNAAGLPDLDDECVREGMARQFFAQALGRAAIIAWEGVSEADSDAPAPVTPETVDDLMELDPLLAETFLQQYTAERDRLTQAKNGSAPSPSGTSAGGTTPVNDAAILTPPVVEADETTTDIVAPTSNTSP